MAMGLALMINLRLPQNFDSPYHSLSIIDFWRRWHMTLGLWVKDYLYIPMGGNRHGQMKKMRNLFVSMLIIGLWHGAGWTYVFWGALHGVMLMVNHLWRTLHIELPKIVCWLMTFSGIVVGWVFFRAATFSEALSMLAAMTDVQNIVLPIKYAQSLGFLQTCGIQFDVINGSLGKPLLACVVLLICALSFNNPVRWMEKYRANWRWFAFVLLLMGAALYKMDKYTEFLYFQF
jgi:alginate O-acetyltransferase complex protein AlgI